MYLNGSRGELGSVKDDVAQSIDVVDTRAFSVISDNLSRSIRDRINQLVTRSLVI